MERFRRGRWVPVAFLAYLLLAAVTTWPLVAELGTSLPGGSTDTYMHFWNGWWVGEALRMGRFPYFTDLIFYPKGVSLIYHNLAWFNIIPWLLLRPFLQDIVAFNLVILLNLALCGLAMLLLVNLLTGNKLAAFVSGVIYLAWPFRLTQLDHPNLISTYWLPITLLFLILLLRDGHRRYALWAGVALAFVGYTRWQLLIPAAFVVAAYLLGTLPTWIRSRRRWLTLLLAAGVTALFLAPPAALLAREWQATSTTGDELLREGEEAVMQTDLLAYVTPGDNHPLWGDRLQATYDRYYGDRSVARRFPAYIGVLALLLALLAVWHRRRESVPWLLMASILVSLALGATLRIAGQFYPQIPTFYRLLQPLYLVRLIRVPDRFNISLALPVAVLAGYGAAFLLARMQRQGIRSLLALLLAALIAFEYLSVPIPRQETALSPFYGQLAAEVAETALLNVPIDPLKAKDYMFAQVTHGRPIVQGKVARVPPGAYSYIDGHPWLRVLRQVDEMPPWLTDVSRQLGSLASDGVDYLILHRTLAGEERLDHWQRYLPFRPRYEDESVIVYATEPEAGIDFTLLQELKPGIGPVRTQLASTCLQASGNVAVDVAWGTTDPIRRSYQARLSLLDENGHMVHDGSLPLMAEWSTEQWPANALVWSYLTLETPPSLPAGRYDVILSLVEQGGPPAVRSMRLGHVDVMNEPCRFETPPGTIELNARFGERLRLLGYSLQRDPDRLRLTLHWRSMRRMDTDYKIFVHVFQPQTGVPVAQDDAMPHQGGYPTTFWAAGETIIDHVPVDLADAPPGNYGIAVGVYDPATMARLPLIDGQGRPGADGLLVLPNETVRISAADQTE